MKKNNDSNRNNDFDEFVKRLEEAVANIQNNASGSIVIDISINICPNVGIIAGPSKKAPVDILETEKNIHAIVGLPGMKKESIELSCSGRMLEVTASNAQETLKQTIELPARVNKTGMRATYENGILEVIFNKPKKRKSNA